MRVQDMMSKKVATVPKATTVATARERLAMDGIDHLLVVENDRLAGVVAGRDLAGAREDAPLSEVMSHPVVTIEPQATLRRAAGIMHGRNVGSLPVLEDGRLVGILTTSDLLAALSKGEIHAAPPGDRVILRKRGQRKRPQPIPF